MSVSLPTFRSVILQNKQLVKLYFVTSSWVAIKLRMLTATQISGGKCGFGSLVVMYSLKGKKVK